MAAGPTQMRFWKRWKKCEFETLIFYVLFEYVYFELN